MPNVDDLILFADVVEQGSFSRVAEQRELTNSVVSKRVARLEQQLAVQLLYRTTRKLTLTEAGQALYSQAKHIALSAQEAFAEVGEYGESLSGKIRISVPTISGELLLAEALAAFSEQHPEISIEMSMDNRFVDLLEDGFDLVIRTGSLPDSSLIARHIIDSHWVVVASPAYLKQHGTPKAPDELKQHRCLSYSYQEGGAEDWLFKVKETTQAIRINSGFSTNNARALRKTALAGHGLIYVPRCLVYQDLAKQDLQEVLTGQAAKVLGIYAMYPFTRQQPKKIKLLIEHIRQHYLAISEYF
ncbi:LysR family transcriptional regulator [Agarivorans sp. B2Z047]|uniref:LysR family transcriptional regulator n=1 Tax=Agarivorans sp. B2Z047 TaxID=2652721 RepID=UPI00128CC777|nr:LysR family transcriptional regulator [Agarivorans sp. B2Z047]MPW29100.1 LysR family transcriptional regulator [Agarivorans sp. B2Z047]UQN41653.1 LysR family transcriptional regulator [Agarivorans sp. B2Z047]